MSDNSQELKIHVISDADTKGFQQTSQASKTLKVDTSDLSDETKRSLGMMPQTEEGLKKTAKASEEAGISHREQREAVRELTHGYPELGAMAHAALNPITIAAFGIAEAFRIWAERIATAKELLGGWELPDMTVHASGVSASAEAYGKLASAVAGADKEFDSAASNFERQAKAIQAQLTATKALIDAQKQKAIADLDLQRAAGQISPGMYEARRGMIEQGANDQTTQAEINARNADLAAKKAEAQGLAQQSADAAAKAAKIQPGLNDAGLGELIDKAKAAAEEAKKKAAEFNAEATHADEIAGLVEPGQGLGHIPEVLRNTPEILGFAAKYGGSSDPSAVAKMNRDAAKDAEDKQAALEESVRKLEKQRDDRKKANDDAAHLAAEAEKKNRELAGEDDPNKVGSVAWQNAQAAAAQHSRDDTGLENQFTKDLENFNKDAAEYKSVAGRTDPASLTKARQAMTDMYTMVNDAMAIMQQLAADHQNIAALRQQVAVMARQIQNMPHLTQ